MEMAIAETMTSASETSARGGPRSRWVLPAGAPRASTPVGAGEDAPELTRRAKLARAAAEARLALAEAVDAAALAVQRAQSVSAELEEALAALGDAEVQPPVRQRAAAPSAAAPTLSPREREVLALVAEGRSNKAIAEALYVSPNTIKTHIASLLYKLRAETRVQLAVIAARQAPL